jgi:plastocyanin
MNRIVSTLGFLFLMSSLTAFAGTIEGRVSGPTKGTVVYVDAAHAGTASASSKTYVVDQKSMQFIPHELVIPVGSTVVFKNDDFTEHNVMWPSVGGDKSLADNLGTFYPDHSVSFKFNHPGVVPVLCNIHPEMSAYIVVTPTPYAATTKADGNYQINNVPDGNYKVTAWHEPRKIETKSVTVAGSTTLDFNLSK